MLTLKQQSAAIALISELSIDFTSYVLADTCAAVPCGEDIQAAIAGSCPNSLAGRARDFLAAVNKGPKQKE